MDCSSRRVASKSPRARFDERERRFSSASRFRTTTSDAHRYTDSVCQDERVARSKRGLASHRAQTKYHFRTRTHVNKITVSRDPLNEKGGRTRTLFHTLRSCGSFRCAYVRAQHGPKHCSTTGRSFPPPYTSRTSTLVVVAAITCSDDDDVSGGGTDHASRCTVIQEFSGHSVSFSPTYPWFVVAPPRGRLEVRARTRARWGRTDSVVLSAESAR